MASDNPTNGELKIMLDDIKETILEIKADGKEVKIQTTKTNGRATALEGWSNDTKKIIDGLLVVSEDYKKSKIRMYTAISILVFFIGSMTALIVVTAKLFIHQEVTSAFSVIEKSYNIQVDNIN
jgi:hypothetical protein